MCGTSDTLAPVCSILKIVLLIYFLIVFLLLLFILLLSMIILISQGSQNFDMRIPTAKLVVE